MALDPQAQALLQKAAAAGLPPPYKLSVDAARARMAQSFATVGEPEPVAAVQDLTIPGPLGGLGGRLYRPTASQAVPVLVFFHGGGWTINSVATHDLVCRRLANESGCAVFSVEFRLAPEHAYPAPIDDAYLATCWVAANAQKLGLDSTRIAVGGDSSGGTMATVVALLARDRGGPAIKYQLMLYPPTDFYHPGTPSYEERAVGYSLNREFMVWFWDHYAPKGVDHDDPYLCPLRAKDLSGMPPALLATAEYDPLRDEGRRYAERLRDSGVPVDYRHFDDQMHGFIMQSATIDRARVALVEFGKALGAALGV